MGLDLLDITFRIERQFGIDLSQDDFKSILHDRDVQVGDLYDLILRKLHLRDVGRNDIRLNHALWTNVQELIGAVTEIPLEQIELKTPLATLFPGGTRRATWEALRQASPYRIGKLGYPRIVRTAGFLLAAR